MSEQANPFAGWVILELLGHRRLAGYLTEQEIAGAPFLRLDIPESPAAPAATQFYAPGAVYAITPTTEALARRVASLNRPVPVHRWELPAPRPRPVTDEDDPYADDAEDDEDQGYAADGDEGYDPDF